ncbi:hypothetical protein KKC00_01805 [Patescibacteria group bacterium]|nr:hypothetical protein [Patescibacteria group bacterium]
MKYNDWTLGQVEAVFNKLGGDDGVRRFLAGELVVKPVQPELKVFKTIKLGTGLKTADDFRKALKDNGFSIGDYANDILDKPAFTVATEEIELDLVVISVAELGFKNGATREQIYARAKELGLDICPAEVGPQLRLQYKDQPNNEWLVIAMEPIADSDGGLGLFNVRRHDSALWLCGYYGYPDYVWYSARRFVFSRRK